MANVFDLILTPILVLAAYASLWVKDLFTGVVFFIIFGLLASLAWVQLNAPDIALVEAAIGAGLIGALFLGALGRMESLEKPENTIRTSLRPSKLLLILSGIFAMIGLACFLALPDDAYGLWREATTALSQSGTSNLTTAVIINYRGYDTMLEVGVMLLVAIGIYVLREFQKVESPAQLPGPEPLFIFFLRFLTPMMILFGCYLLWIGSKVPGGAFQAGSMIAGAGIILFLAGVQLKLDYANTWIKATLAIGLFIFLIIGIVTMFFGHQFLEYPVEHAKKLVLMIESFATVSIAATLLSLFGGCSGFLQKSVVEKRR